MNDPNPYQAPAAPPALDGAPVLAGRGERFGAALIDGVISLATFLPLAAVTGYFGRVMDAARGGEQMRWSMRCSSSARTSAACTT